MRRVVVLLAALATLAAATAAVAAPSSRGTLLIAGIPQKGTILGDPSAPVTLIQYEDLGCTHCLDYTTDSFPTVVKEYVRPGRVKVDFRGLGIVTPASLPALRYALAAGRQNKLWQVAALYFDNQARLDDLVSESAAKRLFRGLDLDLPRLLRDAKSAAVTKQVNALVRESVVRKVPGTPWFFVRVGAGPLEVAQPEAFDGDSFRAILDEALSRG